MYRIFRSPLVVVVALVVLALALIISFSFYTTLSTDEVNVSSSVHGDVVNYSTSGTFPVGVNPENKTIVENPVVDWYVTEYLSININRTKEKRFVDRLFANISKWDLFQQLASPLSRILVIYSGERKEEVVKNFGDILRWTAEERKTFSSLITEMEPILQDGKFYPGRYTVPSDSSPEDVAKVVMEKFVKEILSRYDESVDNQVPIEDALIIASLLEREAYDFTDMRVISGVIWNRLFVNMPLQLDATLQYARGSKASESKWWPKVHPNDKYINSAFNTYKHAGLPPSPIANPSLESVVAALNPKKTECMFYFHDADGKFYCNVTYEAHVAELKKVYGRGK